MFDTTMTDIELPETVAKSDGEWRREAGGPEPDLVVEGLKPSLVSRLLAVLGVVAE